MLTVQNRAGRVLIPIVIVLCILVVLFKNKMIFPSSDGDLTTAGFINKNAAVGSSVPVIRANEADNNVAVSPEKAEQEWSPVMRNEAKRAEIIKWFASHGTYGFNGPDEHDDYESYDEETLKKLDEVGDMRAMHVLANRQETLTKKEMYLHRAALYGSTGALLAIATSIETRDDLLNKPVEERKPYEVAALAFYEAARLRGDQWTYMDGDSLLRRYPIELTQKDMDYIRVSGKNIYDELQGERNKLGLGDFDNSVPDVVNEFFTETIGNLCDKRYKKTPSVLLCNSN